MGLKKQMKSALIHSRGLETRKDNLSHSLKGAGGGSSKNFVVSTPTTTTNTPVKSTVSTGGIKNSMKETLEQLTLLPFQNTTSSVRDFLANLSALLGSEEDSKILEAHSSLRLCESLGLKEHHIYYLRTSRDSSPMMKGIHSKQSSERWMNWGMIANGKCLTARTSACHKTGSECSLSDILEGSPDPKYFLSEKSIKMIQDKVPFTGEIVSVEHC